MVHSDSSWFIISLFHIISWKMIETHWNYLKRLPNACQASTAKSHLCIPWRPALQGRWCTWSHRLSCRAHTQVIPSHPKSLFPKIGLRQIIHKYQNRSKHIKTSSISILVYRSGFNLENTQMEKRWQQCLRHWAIDHEALVHFYGRFQVPRAWPLFQLQWCAERWFWSQL